MVLRVYKIVVENQKPICFPMASVVSLSSLDPTACMQTLVQILDRDGLISPVQCPLAQQPLSLCEGVTHTHQQESDDGLACSRLEAQLCLESDVTQR